jgi:hypothetical protein
MRPPCPRRPSRTPAKVLGFARRAASVPLYDFRQLQARPTLHETCPGKGWPRAIHAKIDLFSSLVASLANRYP